MSLSRCTRMISIHNSLHASTSLRSAARMAESISIRQPDDFHLHIRDGDLMKFVLPYTSSVFGKAIIMPNTTPPIRTTDEAQLYRNRIAEVLENAGHASFTPLMTIYLTDSTTPEEIQRAKESGFIFGVKLYPAGATTNSDNGVTDLAKVEPALRMMEQVGLPLLIHGEVVEVDIFDREAAFISQKLQPLLVAFPNLRVVIEHATTKEMVEFIEHSTHKHLAATITPHHLMYSRTELFQPPDKPGTAFNPHLFCLPVLKAEEHKQALIRAAISGNPKFFAGTDSAPHLRKSKESSCCAAGVFCAPVALQAYATVFAQAGALDKLEAFMSEFGSDFYGLERNSKRVNLVASPHNVPPVLRIDGSTGDSSDPGNELVPMCAGKSLPWSVTNNDQTRTNYLKF